jgi:Mrp family chromosome partitioning ATPase
MLTTGRWHPPLDARLMPTVIAVGGAEPGIGKSVVVSNLAAAIAGMGRRVVVVDLDFRSPRQHTLFGVKSPEGGLQGWLERKRDRRDEVAQPTRVRNLRLLPGPVPVAPPAGLTVSGAGLRDERRAVIQ